MGDDQKERKKKKYDFGQRNTDGWMKWGDGIFKHPDKKLYDVRVHRRIKVDADKPPKQFFKRARNITSETLAIKKRQELTQQLDKLAQKYEGKDLKWSEAIDMYSTLLESRYKDKRITFSTMDTTISTLKKHTKQWNDEWLSSFTSERIENFINSEKLEVKEDQKVKAPTRMNILKFIRGVFKHMVDKDRLMFNPAKGIYIRGGTKKVNYPTVMSHDEMIKLIKYAKEQNDPWHFVYAVGYFTGCRSGELFSMKFENVDWNNNLIYIKESYDWKTEKHQPTKGKKDRTIPINSTLLKLLKELEGKNGEYVLPRIQDWKNGKAAQIIRQYQKALKIKPTKFHSIRGTFITNLLLQNVPVIKVQKLAGHTEISTTLLYVGMLAEELKGSTDALTLDETKNNIHNIAEAKKKTS